MTKKEIKEIIAAAEDMRIIDEQTATAREASEGRRKEYLRALQKLEEKMDILTPTERTIIRLRYINGLSVEATARRVHYSPQTVKRISKSALEKI